MSYPEKFQGFCVAGPKSWNQFKKETLTPKPFGDRDIDVQIECCGVCGSDVHTITGGWGEYEGPLCVGHEVVGKAVAVGKSVKEIKVGDRVGVGAQVWACLKCDQCKNENENYCPHLVDTYNATYEDGSQAHGGFASHIRAHEYFTFKIPDAIKSEDAAPLMCAGLTTYSPLARGGVGPGKTVAIVGIGGLGHLGIQWAKALGAEVYAITHSPDKVEDCKKLGAKEVINSNDKDWAKPYAFKFDFMLNCSDMTNEFDLSTYLSTLKVGGHFHMVGLPDKPLPQFPAGLFTTNSAKMSGSHIGNNQEMNALLKLAAEKGITPWVETIDISEQGCKEAVERVKENKVHYRFTLVGHQKAFGTAAGEWTDQDAHLSSAVVVSLSAASRTARSFTCNLARNRKPGNGPLALLQATSVPQSLTPAFESEFEIKAVNYDSLVSQEVTDWIVGFQPKRVVVADFGGPPKVTGKLLETIKSALSESTVISNLLVGAEPNVVPRDEMIAMMGSQKKWGTVQLNTTAAVDAGIAAEGAERYQQENVSAFERSLKENVAGDLELAWGSGVGGANGVEKAWEDLAKGTLSFNKAWVYRLE